MALLVFQGKPYFSQHRQRAITQHLQSAGFACEAIQSNWCYFVQLKAEQLLSATQMTQLGILLNATPTTLEWPDHSLLVTPRIGTISPWSTKATQLAQIAGFGHIERVEQGICVQSTVFADAQAVRCIKPLLHDKMVQTIWHRSLIHQPHTIEQLFAQHAPQKLTTYDIKTQGKAPLKHANEALGLALNAIELDYFYALFVELERNPTDAELMMFAQVNSEHCRHKIFNAQWNIDGVDQSMTLFDMIRNTHRSNPKGTLSAYEDNAAVIEGGSGSKWMVVDGAYAAQEAVIHHQIKVETHNHPTAISPRPGAATGAGGEIRDEAATGRGGQPKAGLVGYSVSHLNIPNHPQPWEMRVGQPEHIASAYQIMIEAPVGAASYNNEFGRPVINGYFRSWMAEDLAAKATQDGAWLGYHKPIMLAGGIGQMVGSVEKESFKHNTALIVLGGPAQLIGLGGGASSSQDNRSENSALDFASVQRDNPEMQRRCQEVINRCVWLNEDNPITSIHDVGAGGISNALPELLADAKQGGRIQLRDVLIDEVGMSPAEIWCNESQERYVMGIAAENLPQFLALCQRERCPVAVVGYSDDDQVLVIDDALHQQRVVDLPLNKLLGKLPNPKRSVSRPKPHHKPFKRPSNDLEQSALKILSHPTVGDKSYLITIGDRSVGGLIHRDQMVGPWQVPVADCGVSLRDYDGFAGEVIAVGERTPIAALDAVASARMGVAEAVMNALSAPIKHLSDIKMSANWMVAMNHPNEGAHLYDAVQAIGMELCPQLGISIPVGKDSMSMQMSWQEGTDKVQVRAPVSVVLSAFAVVDDVREALTPQCLLTDNDNELWLIDLGAGKNRLGASIYAEVYQQLGDVPPNLDDAQLLIQWHAALKALKQRHWVFAYHDRSDGGLFACLAEMAFASHRGMTIDLDSLTGEGDAILFNEELGAVFQTPLSKHAEVMQLLTTHGLDHCCHAIGQVTDNHQLDIVKDQQTLISMSLQQAMTTWSKNSYLMTQARDDAECAQMWYQNSCQFEDSGMSPVLGADFAFKTPNSNWTINRNDAPKVAILREQGVNGQNEMAAAFYQAGFNPIDVHVNDLLEGSDILQTCNGLAVCGGFSYGDVLGAGQGWAKSILFNPALRQKFEAFFQRPTTFTFGACNGCQMLASLKSIIPGSEHWPTFVENNSHQFEARLSMVEIPANPSIMMRGLHGSHLPVVVSNAEGRVLFDSSQAFDKTLESNLVAMRYVDHAGQVTEQYPLNPNGSPQGITALTSEDGRVTISMPHPERCFRKVQYSWCPADWPEQSPWMHLFYNARTFLD